VNPLRAECSYCGATYREGIEPVSHGVDTGCMTLLGRGNKIGTCLFCGDPCRGFFCCLDCKADFWQREQGS